MELFKILGRFVIEGADKAKKDISGVGDEAKETSDEIGKSNDKTRDSNKKQVSSWSQLKSKVDEYKAQGMSTSQAWRKATDEMKRNTKETESTTVKSSNGMMTALKKLATAIGAAFAVQKIKEFGLACLQAAADAEAMAAQFSSVFGQMEEDAQKALSAIAGEAGISENRMKGSFTKIAAFAKTTGMDQASSLKLAERAMIAVADSAAFYDRSLEETTESLQSFLKGNYENDAALGLSATETTRNAAANKLYGKSFKDLSEEQKQLTLLQMVEDANKLSGALGQAARESDTWNNVTGNLKQSLTDFKAAIGKHILPTVIDLGKKFVGFVETVTQKVDPAVEWLKENFEKLSDKAKDFRDWLSDLGDHISTSFAPALESISNGFQIVRDAAQPLIDKVIEIKDKLVEYVKSGEGAKDATNFLKDAIEKLAGWVEDVIQWLADFSKWCSENQGTIETIAIVVGSFAAAWGLVNGAVALWEGIATAGAIATGLLEFATWGLGTAIAFLTSPITIAIAIVGALIAIGVLLWKNWDEIKAKAIELWQALKEKFAQIKDAVVTKVTEIKDKAVEKFNALKSSISNAITEAKNKVANTFSEIYNTVTEKVTSVYNKVKEKFDSVKNAISEAINSAKETVSDVIEKIKALFDFDLKLNIKIPKITMDGGEAPWGIGGKGRLPTIDVKWNADAMRNAKILKDPTIFGYDGGKFLGGGEAGNEVVAGETHLMRMISEAVKRSSGAQDTQTVTLLAAILDAITGGNKELLQALLAGHTLKVGEREFGRLVKTYA